MNLHLQWFFPAMNTGNAKRHIAVGDIDQSGSVCLRNKNQTTPRQVNIKLGVSKQIRNSVLEKMKQKIDSVKGRAIYSQRLGTVEPVFGNINTMIGFKRFSLRGKTKVNAQWQLVSLVHNILKVHRYGWN